MRMRVMALLVVLLAFGLSAAAVTTLEGAPEDAGRVEAAREAAKSRTLGHYGMTPILAASVAEGDYPVAVASTSPFFRIVDAVLHVAEGRMTADITIGSLSYDRVRVEEDIQGEPSEGRTVFHIPVPALNQPFDCAAHSVRRDQWYERQLLVDAASLPEGALDFELPDYEVLERALLSAGLPDAPTARSEAAPQTEPAALDLPDGEYAIEVNLTGGSGRASVSSPTWLILREGRAWARLMWSSASYDYMLVGGVRYENLAEDGGSSTFEVPVLALDAPFPVVADTTAMGDPVEIEYQLTFYADTIGDKSQVPQEGAKRVLAISLSIIVAGGVMNHFIKRRRR